MQRRGAILSSVIVFDVNGTLLDTDAITPEFRHIFGARFSVQDWLGEALHYSLALNHTGSHMEFGQVAESVLLMCAEERGLQVGAADLERVRKRMRRLPAFPDVKPALKALKEANFRLATLSNSSPKVQEQQLTHAGLRDFFEATISVDAVAKFKPAVECYQHASRTLAVKPGEILMVAAHPWDLLGASHAGFATAFLKRPGKALFRHTPALAFNVETLTHLAERLVHPNGLPTLAAAAEA